MDNLREDLDELVRSAGWQRFVAHVQQEWGTREAGGGVRFTMAARQASNINADGEAIAQLRQICVAQREVHNLVAWVEDTLKEAQKSEQQQPALIYPRRGRL